MSNEMKDWLADKSEEENFIVEKYPFLHSRDFEGTLSTSDFPMIPINIPNGWYEVFFQMCDDIKAALIKNNWLDKYYMFSVKEKYNSLRCESTAAPKDVALIIQKYEHMVMYICTICGAPATLETQDYIGSFCDNCWKDFVRHKKVLPIKFCDYGYIDQREGTEKISFKEEWDRYINKRRG